MIFLSLNLIKTLNFISRPIKDYTDTFLIFFLDLISTVPCLRFIMGNKIPVSTDAFELQIFYIQ